MMSYLQARATFFSRATPSFLLSLRPVSVGFSVVFCGFTCRFLSQDVDDVEMFERRINAMLTIGIKKEDLTQVPPKSDLEGARGAR